MNYRSIADLSHSIRENLHRLPGDIDLVVGVPRSGLLAANIIALSRNLKLTDLAGYLADSPLKIHSPTRNKTTFTKVLKPSDAKHVLIVNGSICSGDSLESTQTLVAKLGRQQIITYCTAYSTKQSSHKTDVFFEIVELPILFEWDVMHRHFLKKCCLDIDGVLCKDPSNIENDDGAAYIQFLKNVQPLVIPSYSVGHLVTSRLEKYRSDTEQWLKKHSFKYGQLHMLNLPDAKTRRHLDCHASFKAAVFLSLKETELFIESNANQALEIANISRKTVLCFSTQKMYHPDASPTFVKSKIHARAKRVCNEIVRITKRVSRLWPKIE